MLVSLNRNELELLHFCVKATMILTWPKELLIPPAPDKVPLADLEARLAAILSGEEKC